MRYYNQNIFTNATEAYRLYLKSRGKKDVVQYSTPRLKHPTVEDSRNFKTTNHIWKSGDRYYKLAAQYYNDPSMWWVIALYNQKPTEFHMSAGDTVYVPVPLETVLYYVGL
jgi:nucleoid-associated protein YgaU